MMKGELSQRNYGKLLNSIGELLEEGRKEAQRQINHVLVNTYWTIGKYIVEYEQDGKEKASYGTQLLDRLSRDLTLAYGKGFSRSHVIYMRKFYLCYPEISESVIHQLSWTHIIEIIKIDDELERAFYPTQSIQDKWSVRELKRQKKTCFISSISFE